MMIPASPTTNCSSVIGAVRQGIPQAWLNQKLEVGDAQDREKPNPESGPEHAGPCAA